MEAPVCDRVTRSVVEIGRAGFLGSVDRNLLPWVNCEVMSNALPTDIFLRLGENYVFTVHLVINPLLAGVPFFFALCLASFHHDFGSK